MIASPTKGGPESVAFVAGRKVGSAVDRNRAKRRMRAAVAVIDLPAQFDVVLVASAEVNSAPFSQVKAWIEQASDHARR